MNYLVVASYLLQTYIQNPKTIQRPHMLNIQFKLQQCTIKNS